MIVGHDEYSTRGHDESMMGHDDSWVMHDDSKVIVMDHTEKCDDDGA